jgi:hypothetical protein
MMLCSLAGKIYSPDIVNYLSIKWKENSYVKIK